MITHPEKKLSPRYPLISGKSFPWPLLIIWFLIQAFLLFTKGIVTTGEAEQYISEAYHFIQNGNLSSPHYWLYITQIFLIVASVKLKTGFALVIAVQLILNLIATVKIYGLSQFLFQSRWITYATTLVFMFNIPYQVYNTHLYTESCFFSLTIIYTAYLLKLKSLNLKNVLLLLALLFLLSITRPTGILFFPATVLFIVTRFPSFSRRAVIVIFVTGILIFLWTLNGALKTGGSLQVMVPFQQEMVICGVPNIDKNVDTSSGNNSLQTIARYLVHNTGKFMELAKLKTLSFFGFIRPYFSSQHNYFLILFYYPWYLLSVIGIIKNGGKKNPYLLYIISIIFLFWLTSVLTCDDWHNRFVLTITPFIFLTGMYAFRNNHQHRG